MNRILLSTLIFFVFISAEAQKVENIEYYNFKIEKVKNRNFNSIRDTLIGDWQYFQDEFYFEILFTKDTLYEYSYVAGKISPYAYQIEGNYLTVTSTSGQKKYILMNVENINTILMERFDTSYVNGKIDSTAIMKWTIRRIPEKEFRFSNLKYWNEYIDKTGKTTFGKQTMKFINDFNRRREEYEKYAL
ncbi:hypothetical protein ACFLSE_09190 [Bacteroidota bacterium]